MPKKGNWLIKLHCKNSSELQKILLKHKVIPIIIYRNLNKAIESHYHYALSTKFHPDYNRLNSLSLKDGMRYLEETYKRDYEKWINEWKNNKEVILITYEQLLKNTNTIIEDIVKKLNLDYSSYDINKTIEINLLKNMKKRSVHKKFFRGSEL